MVGEVLLVMRDGPRWHDLMVVVTHEILEVADRVLSADQGCTKRAPAGFFQNSEHPRTQKFLADIRTLFFSSAV